MAGTAVSVKVTGVVGSDVFELRKTVNLLVAENAAFRTAINAILTAAATNIAAVAAVAPVAATTSYLVNTVDGVST